MDDKISISIAEDFYPYPAGRDDDDGPYNGKKFRTEVLLPRLIEAEQRGLKLVVSLDGLKSCGSSFLESAFGGLIRNGDFDHRSIWKNMEIKYDNPILARYARAVEGHVKRAKNSRTLAS